MKKIIFTLSAMTLFFSSCSSDDNSSNNENTPTPPTDYAVVEATVGGPNQPNQVFIDLSTTLQTTVKRDTWDLGFSTGSDFRVIINGSIKMAVKQLNTTNIDEVQEADATVAVGYTTDATLGYVDNPTGVLTGNGNGQGTAIAAISANDADNKVYLVNLGYNVGTSTPDVGSVALDGEARGWKKIRITRSGNDYVLHYADLNATTHQTVTISKETDYNFVFMSLSNGQKVNVQPQKNKWDLCFTGFTNYLSSGGGEITYYFADFITTNLHGNTKAYEVLTSEITYEEFDFNNVIESKLTASATDQRIIGSNWRSGGGPTSGPSIKDDRFYIVQDADQNLYKLRFLALTNDAGERGYPVFEYELLPQPQVEE